MGKIRVRLQDNVYLTYVSATKFKTDFLSAQFITPLCRETAGLNSLLPAVLQRGTERYPDMQRLSAAQDLLYGASIEHSVRKRGENQLWGFVATCIDDSFIPGGERLLEPLAELLGELICAPAMENGLLRRDYVDSERTNLIELIRSDINDKRTYAGKRLLEEMCRGEAYGISHIGEEETVSAITAESLTQHYRRVLKESRLELYYCGRAAMERVEAAFRSAFRALPERAECSIGSTVIHAGAAERKVLCDKMDVTQGKLCLGYSVESEDRDAVVVLNAMFGGTSNSKLFLNVREKLSLCYYASSGYHRSKNLITVSSGIEFANYQKALDEIEVQMEAMRQGGWEDWEYTAAMSSIANSYQSLGDSAGRMEDYYLGQIATCVDREPEAALAAIQTVTPERVIAAAKTVRLDTVYFLTGKEEVSHD